MRAVLITTALLGLLCLPGCMGRRTITPEERSQEYTITTTMKMDAAYNAAQAWVEKTFIGPQAALTVREPAAGLLVAQDHMAGRIIYQPGYDTPGIPGEPCDFAMKITSQDNQTAVAFTIAETSHPVYDEDVWNYLQRERTLADGLAQALGGTVSKAPPTSGPSFAPLETPASTARGKGYGY